MPEDDDEALFFVAEYISEVVVPLDLFSRITFFFESNDQALSSNCCTIVTICTFPCEHIPHQDHERSCVMNPTVNKALVRSMSGSSEDP